MRLAAFAALLPLACAPAVAVAQPADSAMQAMPGMPGMAMPPPAPAPGADTAAPQETPPPVPADRLADRYFDPAAMASARRQLAREHGGAAVSMVTVNLLEYQAPPGGGYRWDGEAWFGGDIDRFVARSEGEGGLSHGLDHAEVQALYSRAVTPYFDLQAGVRQDVDPAGRAYAAVGAEGLLPYWINVEGALFVSPRGELLGRVEGTWDLRLTQRLILQPRAELNVAAQDTRATRTGSGLSDAELGLRLRYEVRRRLAPYIGVSWDQDTGRTSGFARALGEKAGFTALVLGLAGWF